ncbi:hypothetical protein GTH32_17630 [Alteromonas sp. 345S023]|jgi:alkylated DNA nucleotide flippase Atl1|uniref:Methylated-DNA-[protein]-cysteine S-methyltransferase DNA binding domain-containing protein n=1 Tax=Alteromonas profundi TaxID=2696062 RepID=A0A7X5LP54_9ALTE|nr:MULTISPECIES: MGMT family protein [Alteromonas]MAI36177.1 hypothetical protein [Alteromonas sp.]NDV92992.1 hypothetical protein [Alteromonas profundi]OUX91765.1 MAG: hypothetical protein CBB95_01245 [Alteromonas sp. TMED35]|tara:strand:+ start:21823 stop:22122 length:300 start_codon:yes stop_codon:yes gene_type:complete
MNWEDTLIKIQNDVPPGKVTTYKEIALWAFGNPMGTQAVTAMLKAAVSAEPTNALLTNRVIPESGKLADPNGQVSQLLDEGVPMHNGVVDMKRASIVRF